MKRCIRHSQALLQTILLPTARVLLPIVRPYLAGETSHLFLFSPGVQTTGWLTNWGSNHQPEKSYRRVQATHRTRPASATFLLA